MDRTSRIIFGEVPIELYKAGAFITEVGTSIVNNEQLFKEYEKILSFPGYFGHNWNALLDCLADLWWFNYENIVIKHTNFPKLPVKDRVTYLEVLYSVIKQFNQRSNDKCLIIVFPKELETKIKKLLPLK